MIIGSFILEKAVDASTGEAHYVVFDPAYEAPRTFKKIEDALDYIRENFD